MNFFDALKTRRSQYSITGTSKISDDEILEIVREGVKHAPSAFNSQTTRAFVLFGENHDKLWNIVKESLINKIGEERYAKKTAEKIEGFKAGYGTVLYYINQNDVQEMADKYTELFHSWSYQSAGMVIGNVWVGLSQAGLGANLQHYNPLIDEKVKEAFNVPDGFELIGQMPFGDITEAPSEKEFKDIDELVKVIK